MNMATTTESAALAISDGGTIAAASKLEILDVKGNKVAFGSIFESQKTIVVFIRHFFCGSCQAYVERLASVPQQALEKADAKIVIVGCGEWNPIQSYAGKSALLLPVLSPGYSDVLHPETTQFHGPIYADPSRALYHALGMNIEKLEGTPAGQERRGYLTKGAFVNAMQSIWKGPLKHPSLIGKQGNISQLGGDFVLGPGPQCTFASRMQHTEDHIEVRDLMKKAGVDAG
ncbi:hypothetical protein D9615_008488 [Tricholomella constricta]|uniref:Thioredoxin-like protein AAED1 n=1 Tax=Tricholomella constricta TaxID=117010 RepID=A0A8H5M0J8_9AGAR|nr:hypothetical protein D9615_008488 [Tricholomella constricta]